jgi:hypothetical protein
MIDGNHAAGPKRAGTGRTRERTTWSPALITPPEPVMCMKKNGLRLNGENPAKNYVTEIKTLEQIIDGAGGHAKNFDEIDERS